MREVGTLLILASIDDKSTYGIGYLSEGLPLANQQLGAELLS